MRDATKLTLPPILLRWRVGIYGLFLLMFVSHTVHAQTLPDANGQVLRIVPDGSGGVFICGAFTTLTEKPSGVQVAKAHVAHIFENGTVDRAWATISSNSLVTSLAVENGRLYLGGYFTAINGMTRYGLAALSAADGSLLEWNPNAMIAQNENWAYSGTWSMQMFGNHIPTLGALPNTWRNRIGIFDATTAALVTYAEPSFNRINALAIGNGIVYAGGQGVFGAFDAVTGQPVSTFRNLTTLYDGVIWTLTYNAGRIYLGGFFRLPSNPYRQSNLGVLNGTTGVEVLWQGWVNNTVFDVSINNGIVYVGGVFTAASDQPRTCVAAFQEQTGELLPFAPVVSTNPSSIPIVNAVRGIGDIAYLGGVFSSVNGMPTSNLFATASALVAPPTQPASNLVATSQLPNGTGISLAWSAPPTGALGYTIVAVEGTNAATGLPVNGETYTGVPAFTGAATVPFSGQVVFDGTGTSINITGLVPNTNYTFVVYPYNGAGIARTYGTGTPLTATFRTNPPPPPVVVVHPGILTVSSATLNFGDVALGSARTRAYTMSCYNLTVASVTIAPPAQCEISVGGAAFTASPVVFATRATIDQVQIRVRYSPTQNGALVGAITHSVGSTGATATLTGQSSPPSISTSTLSLNFGAVVPSSAATLAYRVNYRNLSERSITLTPSAGYAVSTTGTEPFSSVPLAVPTGITGRFNVFVKFSPQGVGVLGGSVKNGNASVQNTTDVALTGEGEYPLPGVSVQRLNFGDVPIGSCRVLSYTVFPSGDIRDQVTIICPQNAFSTVEISTTGPNGPFTGGCEAVTFSRTSGVSSARVWVRYCPTTSEPLQFAINHLSQPGGQFVNVPLLGRGVGPTITVTPSSRNFGTLPVNLIETTTLTVQVRNVTAPATVTLSTTASTDGFTFLDNSTNQWGSTWTTSATTTNATYRITARFVPTTVQQYRTTFASVVVAQNGSSTDTFTLLGRGVGATLMITTGTLNFNGNFLLTPNTRSYVLRYDNIRTNTIEISPTNHPAFLLSEAQNGVFTTTAGLTFTVGGTAANPVSGNVTAWVRFLPIQAGTTTATLCHDSFISPGVRDASTETLTLRGVGNAPVLSATTATNQGTLRFNDVPFGDVRYYEYTLSYQNITAGTLRVSILAGSLFAVTSATGAATGATATWIGANQAFTLTPPVLNTTATTSIKLWVRFTATQAGMTRSTLAHVSLTGDVRTDAQDGFLCIGETLPAPILTLPTASATSPLYFGGVIVNKSTTQVLTLTNQDITRPLTIDIPSRFQVSFTGEQGMFLSGTQRLEIPRGAATLTIKFTPTAAGAVMQTLRISNGSAQNVNIFLSGEGIKSEPSKVRFVNERMYVRDEPFFPLGWSQIGTRDNYGVFSLAKQLPRMKGVNFLENETHFGAMNIAAGERHSIWKADARDYNNKDTVIHYLRRYLDTCQKGGIMAIINLYEYYIPVEDDPKSYVLKSGSGGIEVRFQKLIPDNEIQAIIGDPVISNHKSLLGWWIFSEPAGKYGYVYNDSYGTRNTSTNLGLVKPSTLADVNTHISTLYPVQEGMNQVFNLAKTADGGRHFIGTMFQAGGVYEMTKMLTLYPNPNLPFFDMALTEYYNAPFTIDPNGLEDFFERVSPFGDNVHIGNGNAGSDGNYYKRFFQTTTPTTALIQDALMANRDVRDFFLRFHPTGASNGGIILKLFGHRYELDTEQQVRSASQEELMHTTFTKIHALQNYGMTNTPRPSVLGGIDIFGYDFFSSETSKNSKIWIQTSINATVRKSHEEFLAYFAKYNLGQVFQAPKINDLQGSAFMRVQVGDGLSMVDHEAERAIKTVVRYHDGFYYLALINTRLNEQIPASTTTGTTRYTSEGKTQVFIPTNNVRLILPIADVLTNAEELSLQDGGMEIAQTLQTTTIQGIGTLQTLTLPTLAAAATRVFRFRAAQPDVTVSPVLLASQEQKHGAISHNVAVEEKDTRKEIRNRESLIIFPNPATETATLHFPNYEAGDEPILTIADMYGNIITQRVMRVRELVLETKLFPTGVYVCSIRTRKGTQTSLLRAYTRFCVNGWFKHKY
jgi:hypothetical protein